MYKHLLKPQFTRLVATHFFYWICFNMFVPILPRHYHGMGMSDLEIGVIVGTISISGLVFRIPAGKALVKYGSAPVVGVGLVFALIAAPGHFFSNSTEAAILSAVFQGIGLACYAGSALTMASLMFEDKYVVDVFSVITLAGMAGVSLGIGMANWFYDLGGIKYIMIIGLIASFISLLTFPKHPVFVTNIKKSTGLSLSKIAVNPKVYIPTLSIFTINFCFSGGMTFLPLLMISRGIDNFNVFFVTYSVVVIIFRIINVRLCHSFEVRHIEGASVAMAALAILTASIADSWQLLILCGTLSGVSMGIGFPSMGSTVTGGVAPVDRAIALSLFTGFSDLGMVAGATGLAVAIGLWGYSPAFLLAGVISLIYAVSHRLWLVKKLAVSSELRKSNEVEV